MKTQKLTPKQKGEIAARVAAGERQTDLRLEYDVSHALISRIVKQSKAESVKEKYGAPVVKSVAGVSSKSTDQLYNRYQQLHKDLLRHNEELAQRLLEADGLRRSIELESQKDEGLREDGWILAQKQRLTWCQNTSRNGYEMARLYQEASAILQTFAKRSVAVPVVPILIGSKVQ